MKRFFSAFIALFLVAVTVAQTREEKARLWADSVLHSLTKEQRIAQLMIIRAHSNLGAGHVQQVTELIRTYNVGGLCFFQGGPVRQARLTNYYQQIAQTPLLITIDAEWGLGMRLDSVLPLPKQLMLGAAPDAALAYTYGRVIGIQCRRMGIHLNYAPVVDVNNNPNNPVINDRSFGEDKYKVSLFGVQLMKGMNDVGIMTCAKHFPGHGDTETDSHFDLPVIQKSRSELDSLELHPFREMIRESVHSVMVGHLYIPAIDNTKNIATSLSYNNVTKLLRDELQFKGLIITDGLEMKGVTKFFPDGEASVQALIAGNDLLCLPEQIPTAIEKIKKAIKKKKLSWDEIDSRVYRVLVAKYLAGLDHVQPIEEANLVNDLNSNTNTFIQQIAEQTVTMVKNDELVFPVNASALSFLRKIKKQDFKIAYIAVGISEDNTITKLMREQFGADVFFFNYKQDGGRVPSLVEMMENNYRQVIVGVHNYSRKPANQFGISTPAMQLVQSLIRLPRTSLLLFGNPYAARYFCQSKNIMIGYEDLPAIQSKMFDVVTGKIRPLGTLPVTVCENMKAGTGLHYEGYNALLPRTIQDETKFTAVDSIVADAINARAFPGCVVLAVKDGTVVFEKAYGTYTYDGTELVQEEAVFDMASVTKIMATTLAVMKLYEEGKLDLKQTLGYYLPWVRGSNKEGILIEDLLLHRGGLKSWIPFYKETIDTISGVPHNGIYSRMKSDSFTVRVAEQMYMRTDWLDTMKQRILQSELGTKGAYVYSDNDFIFLGEVVEQITGMSLDAYVRKTFYEPMGLQSTGFFPRNHITTDHIVPTENEVQFRRQLLRGDVHDPAAAMMGGMAGHAGLFSTAYEMAVLMQLLCNGGSIGNLQFFQPATVALFTSYGAANSRRGLGFDKPERDNTTRKQPYPCRSASPATFGHTGYTGTCVWADPANKLVYIFLSNRVYPDGGSNTKIVTMDVRGKIQEEMYKAEKNAE